MLSTTSILKDFAIGARDGELGTVTGFYFDDNTWTIRYILVDTGGWLSGRQVLLSPISVVWLDWETKRMEVSLTKEQVEKSPDIETQRPVSRQHEATFLGYYGYPYYWDGPYLWGMGLYPGSFAGPIVPAHAEADSSNGQHYDAHLRSTEAVTGYHIQSADGAIGHVDGFVVEDKTWAIRYIEVALRNWLPGKKVLVAPAWIERVSWLDSRVYVGLSSEAIKTAPEYIESRPITREYEDRLHSHYGRPPYWVHDAEHTLSLSGV